MAALIFGSVFWNVCSKRHMDFKRSLVLQIRSSNIGNSMAHPWLTEQLCRLMDCQKLSFEACTYAAQNEKFPLRIIVQVLFIEQLQLRSSIAGCFLVSENLDGSRPLRSSLAASSDGGGWVAAVRENQVLKVGMDQMRLRVSELEKECSSMRQEIDNLGRGKGGRKFGFGSKVKSQMCSAQDDSVSIQEKCLNAKLEKHTKHQQHFSLDV